MKRVKSFDEFVNENIGAALGSPVKYIKIKNNLKKFQQTKVQQSLNNVDYEKKKQKSKGELDKKTNDTLKAANAAKNQALADKGSAIQQRMKDLATTEPLKKVVTIGTTKAKVAAAETALKAADAEETKQLKVKIAKLNQKAAKETASLKDYVSTEADDKPAETKPAETKPDAETTTSKDNEENTDAATGKEANTKKALEDAEAEIEKAKQAYNAVKDGDDEKAKLQAEIKLKQARQKKAKAEGNTELVQGFGDDIGEVMKKLQDLDKTPDDPGAKLEADIKAYNDNIEAERTTMNKAAKDLEQAKRDLKTGRGSEDKIQKLQKAIEDSKEDIAELKRKEAAAKKELESMQKESVTEDRSSEIEKMIKDKAKPKNLPPSVGEELKEAHAGESMGDKFRRLMAQHNLQNSENNK